ncbi:MAG: PQQ-dependent sugar dehydrogenase [Wenzhouxiangellaceae bacterium]|nr:PQQ-dependent sugar dehydrogenase [Wenzhouxiangellaceae bacterium]
MKTNRPIKTNRLITLLVASVFWAGAAAETLRTEYEEIELEQLVDGLNEPWAIEFLPDGQMLVTERGGRLVRIDGAEVTAVSGAPEVAARGQGGLLDVALHPDFESNQFVYLTWSRAGDDGVQSATTLSRGRLDGDALVEVEQIFTQDRLSSPGRHYGSRLAWLPDGTLLMSIGDRGAEPPRAQDLDDHAGSLLRLTEDGEAAPDNPFTSRADARPEIWSYGQRNIQGLMVHPETGEIWATEHGPRGGDELNRVVPGANYGWPVVSLGRNYRTEEPYFDYTRRSMTGIVDPVVDWTPGLHPSGLTMLTDDTFPAWQGNFLSGGLATEQIRRIVFENGEVVHEERLVQGKAGRVRDLTVGPDGFIYFVTDNGEDNDGVWRISPATGD